MHRKAINPLQELIWSTLAYLLWHGRRFYIPAGRIREKKNVFPCFKVWRHSRISTDFIFGNYLLWQSMQGRESLIVRGPASTAACTNYSNSSPRPSALPNRFTLVTRGHAQTHATRPGLCKAAETLWISKCVCVIQTIIAFSGSSRVTGDWRLQRGNKVQHLQLVYGTLDSICS